MKYRRHIAVEERVDRDGRRYKVWHVRKRIRGRARHRAFSSRPAAEVYLRALELEAAGVPTRVAPATVGEVLDGYLASRERLGRRETTIHDYRQVFCSLRHHLGEHASIHLEQEGVLAYVDARRADGAGAHRILRELALLQTAIRRTISPRALSWELPELQREARARRIPPDAELGLVWAALDRLEHRRALALALLTGLRQEDVLSVTWGALAFDPAAWATVDDHDRVLDVRMSKRRGQRHLVWVCSTLAGLLWAGGSLTDPIIGCTPASLRTTLSRRTKEWPHRWNGIGHLRHTCATWLAQSGAFSDAEIGLVLGHAVGGVARAHYIQDLALPLRRRAAEALEERALHALGPALEHQVEQAAAPPEARAAEGASDVN